MTVRCSLLVLAACLAAAGCGGGGGGGGGQVLGPPVQGPAPPAGQSPGGIWRGIAATGETFTFLVAESGELRVLETNAPQAGNPPAFGSGALLVSGATVSGAYDARRLSLAPGAEPAQDCELAGSLTERVLMQITIDCTDDAGGSRSVALALGYDRAYDEGSSLAALEGNYTLSFKPATNVLSINANGEIFGQYDNGANCTINGTVEALDPRFNLYRFEWHFSLCEPPLLDFEGVTMTGFGHTAQALPSGSFFVLLTGVVGGHLMFVSVLYQPS